MSAYHCGSLEPHDPHEASPDEYWPEGGHPEAPGGSCPGTTAEPMPPPYPVGQRVRYVAAPGTGWSRNGGSMVVPGDVGVVIRIQAGTAMVPGFDRASMPGWSTVRFHDDPTTDAAVDATSVARYQPEGGDL